MGDTVSTGQCAAASPMEAGKLGMTAQDPSG